MSRPLRTIVIGTSLTDVSDRVVRTGVALARATGATPWLVHSYLPYLPTTFPSGGGIDAQVIEEQVKSLQEQLTAQARRTGLSKLASFSPDQFRLVVGSPHREIVDLARHVQADLVVVGTAESTLGILGSTADRVIRKAPCPVFAVRSEGAFPPTRVEIPVDLSPISAHSLRQGLSFLKQIGVPLTETEVLFVLDRFEVGGSIQFTQEQVERFASEELQRFVETITAGTEHPPLARVCTGFARQEILTALMDRRVDLAVLGTHGRGGFERLMIGSVASGVLREASCNLLVVPPGASHQNEAAERWEELAGADWSYVSDENPVAAQGGRS